MRIDPETNRKQKMTDAMVLDGTLPNWQAHESKMETKMCELSLGSLLGMADAGCCASSASYADERQRSSSGILV